MNFVDLWNGNKQKATTDTEHQTMNHEGLNEEREKKESAK